MYIVLDTNSVAVAKSIEIPAFGPRGLVIDDDVALSWATAANTSIVQLIPPADFVVGKYKFDGTALVPNPNYALPARVEPAELPTLKITAISADGPRAASAVIAADFSEATCPAGTTLTVSVSLVDAAAGAVIPLTGAFRMPLIASDGRERIVAASMADGVASIAVPLAESGVWGVTQDDINRDLPITQHMAFSGIKVYVSL